ncbi:cadherin-7 isoform X6 [Oreochromis niloticus]|uniref:cadherin-7 isoform X6 n=1 Tax=Oreochromis niloticus TaxID=8128 RepID=UPI000DF3777B|nr:cadherin-7 isoform X6 [Oreochromis niloticus]
MFIKTTQEESAVLGPSHLTPPSLLMRRSLTPPPPQRERRLCNRQRAAERERASELLLVSTSFINYQSSSSDAIAVNNLQIHRGLSDQQLEAAPATDIFLLGTPVPSEMNFLHLPSMLTVIILSLWEKSGCGAMTLNSVALPQVSRRARGGGAGVYSTQSRQRRSWVWNQFFVLEEYTGDEPLYIGKLHSDLDKGDGQVRYVLSGEGAMSIFSIDEDTGDIHTTKRLDREQQAYYTLRAQARDRNTNLPLEPESQFIIKVQDINDNEPKFLDGPYVARVAERSPVGTSVVTVVATDVDDPTYGNSAHLVYSILQGQPYFSVEPKSGVVRTALPDMDRELRDHYLLVIQAKDMIGQMGGLSGTTTVTVMLTDVNDNPPRFPRKSYQFSVPESTLVSAVVAKIKALDADAGPNAEMDYRILDGDGLGTFRMLTDPHTQEGLVILIKTLDFETKTRYTLRVEASNRYMDTRFLSAGPFSDVATVRLQVEDVNEPPCFSPRVSQMAVSEAAPVGTEVGSVSAHDPDALNCPIRYAIDRKSDVENYFDIDRQSGVIRTSRRLDRELSALHNITVLATESLDHSQVGKAVVLVSVTDVNDNAPSFPVEYQTFICENAQPGQIIETLSAVDLDEPKNGHHFLFSLAAKAAWNLSFILRDNNGVAMVTGAIRRRRKEPPIIDDERDVRENIVCYDDEGGGEEDTEAFDMFTLRHLNETKRSNHATAAEPPPSRKDKHQLFQEFIKDQLREANLDMTAPPFDSVQTYAFEGSGSAAVSLSSFSSLTSLESEQSYHFLSEWGPKFRKLAELYRDREGGGAS